MQLVYQTTDMTRAHEIIDVLANAGIETSLQGVNAWGLERTPVTVWVMDDNELSRANQVLEEFYAREAPQRTLTGFQPDRMPVGIWLFLGVVALCIALGLAMYSA